MPPPPGPPGALRAGPVADICNSQNRLNTRLEYIKITLKLILVYNIKKMAMAPIACFQGGARGKIHVEYCIPPPWKNPVSAPGQVFLSNTFFLLY